jgi:hypothetical protein
MVSVMTTKPTYPVEVNHKGSIATIYRTPIRGEPAFTITFYECAKRRRKVVMDESHGSQSRQDCEASGWGRIEAERG